MSIKYAKPSQEGIRQKENEMNKEKCPRCEKEMEGFPALSRRDNKTDICSSCGTVEAMEDYFRERWTDKIYWEEA